MSRATATAPAPPEITPAPAPTAGAALRLADPWPGVRLPLAPIGKPRMTRRDQWLKRPPVVRYHAWCDALRLLAGRAGIHALRDTVVAEYGIPMPASWPARRRAEMAGKPHRQKPDIDNISKALLDAMCDDDSHISTLVTRKVWATDGYLQLFTTCP